MTFPGSLVSLPLIFVPVCPILYILKKKNISNELYLNSKNTLFPDNLNAIFDKVVAI